jgi:hypothetical protein
MPEIRADDLLSPTDTTWLTSFQNVCAPRLEANVMTSCPGLSYRRTYGQSSSKRWGVDKKWLEQLTRAIQKAPAASVPKRWQEATPDTYLPFVSGWSTPEESAEGVGISHKQPRSESPGLPFTEDSNIKQSVEECTELESGEQLLWKMTTMLMFCDALTPPFQVQEEAVLSDSEKAETLVDSWFSSAERREHSGSYWDG